MKTVYYQNKLVIKLLIQAVNYPVIPLLFINKICKIMSNEQDEIASKQLTTRIHISTVFAVLTSNAHAQLTEL